MESNHYFQEVGRFEESCREEAAFNPCLRGTSWGLGQKGQPAISVRACLEHQRPGAHHWKRGCLVEVAGHEGGQAGGPLRGAEL